jgi:hypothetical protein
MQQTWAPDQPENRRETGRNKGAWNLTATQLNFAVAKCTSP